MKHEDYINELKKRLTPFHSNDLQRYGGSRDGAYILDKSLVDQANTVYSLGVGPNDSWIAFDHEMANAGKKVFLYDGSVPSFWSNRPEFKFFSEYISSKNLSKFISDNGHENETEMLLKMDIEGAEYDTILNSDEKLFNHFNQVAIEIHDLLFANMEAESASNDSAFSEKINLLDLLNKHYNLVHIHGNNCSPRKGYGIAEVLELTYIRKDKCPKDMTVSQKACPVEGLDVRNSPSVADITMDWWIQGA
jgi:FkbM family methyltransferase